jgi:hypothetical protein
MVKNDYSFGLESKDFKKNYVQSKFTEKLQKTYHKYTGKEIRLNLIRASKSTYNDTQPMSLAERKKISQQMGHALSTHIQYSKHIGVQRLNQQPTTTPATV